MENKYMMFRTNIVFLCLPKIFFLTFGPIVQKFFMFFCYFDDVSTTIGWSCLYCAETFSTHQTNFFCYCGETRSSSLLLENILGFFRSPMENKYSPFSKLDNCLEKKCKLLRGCVFRCASQIEKIYQIISLNLINSNKFWFVFPLYYTSSFESKIKLVTKV